MNSYMNGSIVPDRVTNTPTALIMSICSMAFLEKVLSVSMSVTEIASSWPKVRETEGDRKQRVSILSQSEMTIESLHSCPCIFSGLEHTEGISHGVNEQGAVKSAHIEFVTYMVVKTEEAVVSTQVEYTALSM